MGRWTIWRSLLVLPLPHSLWRAPSRSALGASSLGVSTPEDKQLQQRRWAFLGRVPASCQAARGLALQALCHACWARVGPEGDVTKRVTECPAVPLVYRRWLGVRGTAHRWHQSKQASAAASSIASLHPALFQSNPPALLHSNPHTLHDDTAPGPCSSSTGAPRCFPARL